MYILDKKYSCKLLDFFENLQNGYHEFTLIYTLNRLEFTYIMIIIIFEGGNNGYM